MNQSTLDLALALAVANGADPDTAKANLAKLAPAPAPVSPDTVIARGTEIRAGDDGELHRFTREWTADGKMTETDAGLA